MSEGSSERRSSTEDLEALLRAANKAEKAAARAAEKAKETKLALVERIMARATEEEIDRLFQLGAQLEPEQVLDWAAREASSTSRVQRARWRPFHRDPW